MRLRKLIIERLFDLFDHSITFNKDERVTIIHGPNGVGKTTILKLLSDLFSKRFHSLRVCPYRRLKLSFENPRSSLLVERIIEKIDESPVQLKFTLRGGNAKHEYTTKGYLFRESKDIRRHIPLHVIDDIIEPLERIGPRKWLDKSTGDMLDIEDVFAIYGEKLPFEMPPTLVEVPDWLTNFLNELPIHFIQTQRLFAIQAIAAYEHHPREPKPTATVERYSQDIVEKIQEILRNSAVLATSLDRTFPQRLLESKPKKGISEKKIRERYEEQAKYRNRLMDAGLIEPEEIVALPPGALDLNDRRVLWHYLNDVNKKFKVFDKLLTRVELFKRIINSRFLYKTFSVDKEHGFLFKSKKSKSPVPLRTLSSGEQHELVLAYELLFRVKQNSLILIDEPELSLHVTWQHKFLEDITKISELTNLDFLVATHSPSIIHRQRHLMVALGENY